MKLIYEIDSITLDLELAWLEGLELFTKYVILVSDSHQSIKEWVFASMQP